MKHAVIGLPEITAYLSEHWQEHVHTFSFLPGEKEDVSHRIVVKIPGCKRIIEEGVSVPTAYSKIAARIRTIPIAYTWVCQKIQSLQNQPA